MNNIVMKSKDRILFDVVIRQDTKDSFLSLSDLNEAYIRAREINGWSEKRLNEILQRDSNVERIYYVIREQIFSENDKYAFSRSYEKSENDKTTKTWFYENYPDYPTFKKVVDEVGLPKVLKQLHLYRMTGRGENRKVMCNPYIWVLVAMEMNPILYAKVVGWITDGLILRRIEATTLNKKLADAIKNHIQNPEYWKINVALNERVYGEHMRGIRNTSKEQGLISLNGLQEVMAYLINNGIIHNQEQLLQKIKEY